MRRELNVSPQKNQLNVKVTVTQEIQGIQKTNSKMTDVSPFLSVIELNTNELNYSKHRLAGWINTHEPTNCCLQEIHFRSEDTKI